MRVRIPLAGSYVTRTPASFITNDQLFINCFSRAVTNPITQQRTIFLEKRYGFTKDSVAGAGYSGSLGILPWSGATASFFPTVLSYWNGVTTLKFTSGGASLGTVTGVRCLSITETLISGVPTLVFIVATGTGNATAGYFYPNGGSLTQITDGDFPANLTGHCVHSDGFMYVMSQDSKIYNSDLNSVSSWTANNFISDDAYPDVATGLIRSGANVIGFGRESLGVYRNAGNPSGSPLRRVDSLKIGALLSLPASNTVRNMINVGESIYWLGASSDSGRVALWTMSSGAPKEVSTPDLEKWLEDGNTGVNAGLAGAFHMHGLVHIMFYVGATSQSVPCYCVDTGQVWFMLMGTAIGYITAIVGRPGGNFATGADGAGYMWSALTSGPVYKDDTSPFALTLQTSKLDFGNSKRKFFKSAELVGDTESTSGLTEIVWSDDDYRNFNTDQNYLQLDGTSGCYASTPDSATLDITGDIELIVYAAANDWTPASGQSFIAKLQTAGQYAYELVLQANGSLILQWSANGTNLLNSVSTAVNSFANGSGAWVRATLDVNDGSGNHVVKFYTSTDPSYTPVGTVSWTQFGTTVTTAGTTSIAAGTSILEVGSDGGGAFSLFAGKIYSAYVYNGIGGTLAASFNAADCLPRSLSFVSDSLETWTINGTAYVTTPSSVDMSAQRARLTRLGSGRRRAFRITDAINRPFRLEALELEYEEGQ